MEGKNNKRICINHKWQCPNCRTYIGEEYYECSICKYDVHRIKRKKIIEELKNNKEKLTSREQEIINMRYGLTQKNGKIHTLKKVGQKFGITRQRVQQIEVSILNKTKKP